jgi:hypothetical protein
VWVAGILLSDDLVVDLVKRLQRHGCRVHGPSHLQSGNERTVDRRAQQLRPQDILAALDDRPAGLEELRAVLLREHDSRQREALG